MNIYYPIVSVGQEFRNGFLGVSGTGFLIAVMIHICEGCCRVEA